MLTDPLLFADHVCDAIFATDDDCLSVQARLGVIHDNQDELLNLAESQRQLGEAIYKKFISYCEGIENEH